METFWDGKRVSTFHAKSPLTMYEIVSAMQQLYSTSREAVAAQLCSTQASGSLWKIAVITAEISRLIVWKVIFLLCSTWNVLSAQLCCWITNFPFLFDLELSPTSSAPRAPLESRPNHLRNIAHFCLSGEQKTRHYSSGSCNSQRRIFRPLCFCFHADNHKLLSRIVVVVVSFLLIYCKCRAAAAARREEGNVVQAEKMREGENLFHDNNK